MRRERAATLTTALTATIAGLCCLLGSTSGGAAPAETTAGQAQSRRIEGLFTVAGKPATVVLRSHADGTWHLDLESGVEGASAEVPMQNGVVVEMIVRREKREDGDDVVLSLQTKLSDEKETWTVRKLPTGKLAPVMLSERCYGERFRMVWEMRADGGYELYFVQEPQADARKNGAHEFWLACPSLKVLKLSEASDGDTKPEEVGDLKQGTHVTGVEIWGEWVRISSPQAGWVFGPALVRSAEELEARRQAGHIMHILTLHHFWHKPEDEKASHLLSWISGKFPLPIVGGAMSVPDAEPGHGAYVRECIPGMSLLGKDVECQARDLLLMTKTGWKRIGRWEPAELGLPQRESESLRTWTSAIVLAEDLPESADVSLALSSKLLPKHSKELMGSREVRITNPNDFAVLAGIRSGEAGVNLTIPANGQRSAYVSDGRYDIFFVYSSRPEALFQGDTFTLKGNGVEIKIVKVAGGNYGIRQVK